MSRRFLFNPVSMSSNWPFSGSVMQQITAPWFSPSLTFDFAGDPAVEDRVVTEVASYGSQLGWLTDMVLALVDKKSPPEDSLNKLRLAAEQITKIKEAVGQTAIQKATSALDDLQRDNGAEYEQLIRSRWTAQRTSVKNLQPPSTSP
jgi:hypothetical protein